MNNGAAITVAREGAAVHGTALKLKDGWWWIGHTDDGTRPSGPLGDEGVHYVRGFLFNWWPPHRKRRDALLTAAALAGPPPEPPNPPVPSMAPAVLNIHGRLFDQLFGGTLQKLTDDANRLIKDAERLAGKGISTRVTTTVTVNGRRVP